MRVGNTAGVGIVARPTALGKEMLRFVAGTLATGYKQFLLNRFGFSPLQPGQCSLFRLIEHTDARYGMFALLNRRDVMIRLGQRW